MDYGPIIELSSGYVSTGVNVNKDLVYTNKKTNTFVEIFLNKGYLDRDLGYDYNEEADELYRLVLKNDNSIKEIDNYVRAIALFKKLFCDMNLLDFVDLQKNSGALTASHIDFLRNTLEFVSKGRGRVLDTGTWRRLVTPAKIPELTSAVVATQLDQMIDEYHSLPNNISDLLVTWINRPSGYLDLIATIYVIFGSRVPIVDFAQ